jgi:hypothetical protein
VTRDERIGDHLGRPSGVTSPSERWANLHNPLRHLYDAFGPARWFRGTDITRMPCR